MSASRTLPPASWCKLLAGRSIEREGGGAPQAAKGLGKAVRAFAPTLQELTSVSRDLKNTLDNELGIDEIRRDLASAQVSAT